MTVFDRKLSDLLHIVYDSVGHPDHWQMVLQQMAVELEATKASMHVHSFARRRWETHIAGSRLHSLGYDDATAMAYANYYAVHDPYVQRIRERFRGQAVGTSDDLLTVSELRRTEFYADYGRPNGIFFVSWAVVEQNKEFGSGLGFIRPEDSKQFTREQVELLSIVTSHLGRSFGLQRMMDDATNKYQALLSSVAQFDISVIALDCTGRIVDVSPPALALLDKGEGIKAHAGRLRATDAGEDHDLQNALRIAARTLDNPRQRHNSSLLLSRPNNKTRLQVVATRFASSSASGALLGADRPWVLVSLSDPSSKPPSREALLRSLYGLTPAESRLADSLLEGLAVNDAAEQMNITMETARFYLKKVLEKTGTHRQSELMKFMLRMPGNGMPDRLS